MEDSNSAPRRDAELIRQQAFLRAERLVRPLSEVRREDFLDLTSAKMDMCR
jgi:hypothetical protein